MTKNEAIRKYISKAVSYCKRKHLPVVMWGDASTAYLAQQLVARDENKLMEFSPSERSRLADWMGDHEDYVIDVIHDLTPSKLAELVRQGNGAMEDYVTSKLTESMLYDLESQDSVPDREAEHDARQRVRDYMLEELGVC
jgi:hypothetical protein